MEGMESSLLEGILCTHFSREVMLISQLAGGGLHTLAQFLIVQLLPLQEPCTVKVVFEEGYQYEFD
jgi:hypothetical protein